MHPELTLPLVPELLNIHPFFDMPEHDVEDPACILFQLFSVFARSVKIDLRPKKFFFLFFLSKFLD